MKVKYVFYLCLTLALVFFSLGFQSGYWFFLHWIQFGAFLMKITFWGIFIVLGVFGLWLMFRKKEKNE